MNDPLDNVETSSDEESEALPPPPPGITLPPPKAEMPPPDFNIPPPVSQSPQFGFSPERVSDGDLLDAANSLDASSLEPHVEESSDFKSVWESRKRADPTITSTTRDSIYNRIDRISSGKGESLMERYSDRFGSDLDREIIVLRKKDQKDLTSIKPTVELISASTNTEMSLSEFIDAMDDSDFVNQVAEKTGVSAKKIGELDLETMESFFQKADIDNSGTLDFDEFVSGIVQTFRSNDEDFSHFFTVVNGLLGELPDDKTNDFIESEGFELFKTVGEDPKSTDRSSRSEFFTMVNELLVDLPDSVMKNFTESQEFDLYKQIAQRYGG